MKRKQQRHRLDNSSGHILLVVLALLGVMTIMLSFLLDGQIRSAQLVLHETRSMQAFYLAESGMEHSLALLNAGQDGRISSTSLGQGRYEVTVKAASDEADLSITALGFVSVPPQGEVKRTVRATAAKVDDGKWTLSSRVEN